MPRNFSRLAILVGAALLAGVPALHAQQTGAPVRGDVDGDGRITAADARIVSDYLVGKAVPAGANVRARGDVNGDGRVTAVDAAIIARAAAGRDVSRFPVGKPGPDPGLAMVECAADVRALSVSCGEPGSLGGARASATTVVGGQDINVRLTSSHEVVNPADSTFRFDVTVKNLLKQAMGADSSTGTANIKGVEVFFYDGPNTNEGTGMVAMANPDSTGIFLAAERVFFRYPSSAFGPDGVLSPGETSSARTWITKYDPGVLRFRFILYVNTSLRYPQGWVNITPPGGHPNRGPDSVYADTVIAGRTLALTGVVRNAFGGDSVYNDAGVKVANPPVKWFSTGLGNATVDSLTGLVKTTKMASGIDSITAVSGQLLVRRGKVAIVVVPPSGPHSVITATSPVQAGDSTLVKVQVYDALNRPVTSGGDSVTLSVTGLSGATLRGTGAAGTTSIIAVDSLNGVYTAWLKSTATGTANLTGKVETQPIGTTTSVTFNAATPALIEKVVPLTTDTINPGLVPTAPKVRVKDIFGNVVPNATVTFTPSPGSSVTGGTQTTNPSGEAAVGSWTIGEGLDSLTVHVTPGSAVDSVFTMYGNKAPVAVRDSIDAIGNVQITATGLKVNDTDPEGRPLNITTGNNLPTFGGGSVNLTALPGGDVTVTYNSMVGFTGVDSVTYTLNDHLGRTATGKLIIRVPSRFWFVQGGASGNGTMASPSGSFTFGAALAAKDSIFLLGAAATVPSGVTLPNGGALIGRGIASNVTRKLGGSTDMAVDSVILLTTGSMPTLTVSSGTGVTLTGGGSGYIVKGLALVTSAGGGISGTNFGTLALSTNELSINATGGAALSLSTGTLLSGALGTLSSSGGTGLSLTSVTGSLSATGGTLNGSASGPAVNVSGATGMNLTYAGSLAQTGNNALVSVSGGHTGTLTFNTGTVTASNGSGLQFDNADGTYAFNNGVTFNGGDAGIDVLNNSGGTFTFPSSSQITGPTAEAIRINASAPTFSYLGRIDKTNGSTGISVTSNTGGTVSLGSRLKKITSTGSNVAVDLTSNGTATITSADSLQIISATGNGYNATGGGTVEVQGNNNTIQSSGGIALNVSSTTVGANGLKFLSVTAAGGSNGIVLSSTGATGGSVTVTGSGSSGTGGSITNATGGDGLSSGNGVYLSNTRNVNLSWMGLSGHSNHAVYGTSVRDVNLDHVRCTGNNGNSNSGTFQEGCVHFVNASGGITVKNSRLDGSAFTAFLVENNSGAPVADSIVAAFDTISTGQGSTASVRGSGLQTVVGSGSVNVRYRNNQVLYWWANGIQVAVQNTAAASTALIQNNTVHQSSGALGAAGGIEVNGGSLAFNISNNSIRGSDGTAISADKNQGNTFFNGTISGNQIGASGVVNSGSATGTGIFAQHAGPNATTLKISNNTIRQINGSQAIWMLLGDDPGGGGAGTLNATITGNNIAEEGSAPGARTGIVVQSGRVSGDTDLMCADVGGAGALANSITNFNTRIRPNQRFNTKMFLPGYTGAAGDNAAVNTYMTGRNPGTTNVTSTSTAGGGGIFNTSPAGSACPQPTL